MRIAVVGSGVSGLVSAWLLSRSHGVTLYEADDRLGGHVHTHEVTLRGRCYSVDSGFIVHNPLNYPLLTRLLDELGVASQPTSMSFSVRSEGSGLEYNAGTLNQLFCQRRNLWSPRFQRMIFDLLRFYREAGQLLGSSDPGPSLGEYLARNAYSDAFRDEHIVPMASALWSSPSRQVLEFPARYLVQFMANHRMLQVSGRPQWQAVRGGSAEYVKALRRRWTVEERLKCPVRSVRRLSAGVEIKTDRDCEKFDHVVLACHSDQAVALLADPDEREREILGAIPYQGNDALLHTDPQVLPRNRRAWAAWNAFVPASQPDQCSVSYYMNLLQGIDAPDPLIVTLNPTTQIDPARILRTMRYEHPVYTHASVAARARKAEIQGNRRTWFAGAYWGWGFHEDGMRSAVEVAEALGARWVHPPAIKSSRDVATVSAVYEGVVRHRRHTPHAHAFQYRVAQIFLDLDEVDQVFAGRWFWSRDRRNLAEFRRSDYFGPPDKSLPDAIRDAVEAATGCRPRGPIRLLTHLRYAGYSFNPVSFYYCYGEDARSLECIVAEITNTPWRERHAYVLPVKSAEKAEALLRWTFPKQFHVSPFMAMDREYEWSFTPPADRLRVHMNVTNAMGPEFDATLVLRRRQLDSAALRRMLWRYPLMTVQVIGAIHWQALRLWLKGNPVYDNPSNARSQT